MVDQNISAFLDTCFQKTDRIIVYSTPTKKLAFAAVVPEKKISIVYPRVSLPEQPQSAEDIAAFKLQHGLEDKKILLSEDRLTTRKGLKEFVEQALPQIVQAEPKAVLVIVGEAPKNSLGARAQSRESIEQAVKALNLQNHVKLLGVITNKTQLAKVYEAADVLVFPVRYISDEPKGFGMVAVEAAAHGLPTVAFATGGIVDAVKHGESGYLVEKKSYNQLSQQIISSLKKLLSTTGIQEFSKDFAWQQFGEYIHENIK